MTHDNLLAIAALVPAGSRVLDLGCGDGALLARTGFRAVDHQSSATVPSGRTKPPR